jgi:two-component system chemotaxis response regulator CheB
MPDKFTRTFAERLDRKGNVRFAEAQDGDAVSQNTGFVCPGRRCMQVVSLGKELRVKVTTPAMSDRYVPSADRLFQSVASVAGAQSIAVILTGMGDDAVEGARAIRDAGGRVIAESKETAVVYGMPGAVVRAGLAHDEWPLPKIAQFLADLPH